MFFKCSACQAKDAHIETLQKQVETLSAFVYPKKSSALTEDEMALDAIASGGDFLNPPPMTQEELEAHLLLTGSWEDTAD